jgi:hypothetical protein
VARESVAVLPAASCRTTTSYPFNAARYSQLRRWPQMIRGRSGDTTSASLGNGRHRLVAGNCGRVCRSRFTARLPYVSRILAKRYPRLEFPVTNAGGRVLSGRYRNGGSSRLRSARRQVRVGKVGRSRGARTTGRSGSERTLRPNDLNCVGFAISTIQRAATKSGRGPLRDCDRQGGIEVYANWTRFRGALLSIRLRLHIGRCLALLQNGNVGRSD